MTKIIVHNTGKSDLLVLAHLLSASLTVKPRSSVEKLNLTSSYEIFIPFLKTVFRKTSRVPFFV